MRVKFTRFKKKYHSFKKDFVISLAGNQSTEGEKNRKRKKKPRRNNKKDLETKKGKKRKDFLDP